MVQALYPNPDVYCQIEVQADCNKSLFLDNLHSTQEWLVSRGIPYALMGSIATSAYIDGPDNSRIDFNRQGQRKLIDRVPDIDVVVPRGNLDEVRAFRDEIATSINPVSIGLSFASRFIDYRPDDEHSYLTHGNKKIAVDSSTLAPVGKDILSVPTLVFNAKTLYYTYYMINGKPDQKYVQKLAQLRPFAHIAASETKLDYDPYDKYVRMREDSLLPVDLVARSLNIVGQRFPTVKSAAKKSAMPLASKLGLR